MHTWCMVISLLMLFQSIGFYHHCHDPDGCCFHQDHDETYEDEWADWNYDDLVILDDPQYFIFDDE